MPSSYSARLNTTGVALGNSAGLRKAETRPGCLRGVRAQHRGRALSDQGT
jgi:hypothetical protein